MPTIDGLYRYWIPIADHLLGTTVLWCDEDSYTSLRFPYTSYLKKHHFTKEILKVQKVWYLNVSLKFSDDTKFGFMRELE
jgi:hypothetical protein